MMVLAGGKGQRLVPLTAHRAKPAVPFAGRYRIIDFVLSNLVNAGYRNIYVLTQFMATSLIKHLNRNWHLSGFGQFIEVTPAQMRSGERWYQGTADSVWQNRNLLADHGGADVGVFAGDHIYKMDVGQMERFHRERDADLTIAAYPVPLDTARHQFGVFEVDDRFELVSFQEKPAEPAPMPGDPSMCLASMGNYFFKTDTLLDALETNAQDPVSRHDFGRDVIPRLIEGGARVAIYDFATNTITGEPEGQEPYWRDVGTLDAYFDANQDLRAPVPSLNLYNFRWRIRTAQRNYPPARFVRGGDIVDSMVCEGTIVHASTLKNVITGYDCFIHENAEVEDSVILSGCDIGAGSRLKAVLMDKNCRIEPGAVIGEDPDADRERFPFITAAGRVVLPKGTHVPRKGPIRLAADMHELMQLDTVAASQMQKFAELVQVAPRDRHSHMSVGPRFRKFGATAVD